MGQAVYVARVNTTNHSVENVEVADSDWLVNEGTAVTGYAFIPYSVGESVSLGTGTWIADGYQPPQPSHFCALHGQQQRPLPNKKPRPKPGSLDH